MIDVSIPTDRNVTQREGRKKETTISEILYIDKTKMENEMYDHTGRNWGHRNSNKRF